MDKTQKMITFISLLIFIVIMFILGLLLSFNSSNNISFNDDMPKIEIKNKDIDIMYEEIEELKDQNYYGEFQYLVTENNKYLSTIIQMNDNSYIETQPIYYSYIFDKETGKKISEDELLKKLNISRKEIIDKINEHFRKYYDEEEEEGYYDKRECDYGCYLDFYRNIKDLESSYVVGVEDKHIVVYVSFDENSFSDDLEYFEAMDENPHRIIIK